MAFSPLPPLPGLDPEKALTPDDPGYSDWLESVVYNSDGVDRLLIWENLHRSPSERLERLQAMVDFVYSVHGRQAGVR